MAVLLYTGRMRRTPCIDAKDPFRGRSILLPFGLLIAVFATLFSGVRPAAAATAIWTQTDWSGGLDGGTGAVHPTDQAGWTRYASVNGMSGTASPGNALLSTQAFTATDDGTLTTTGIATGKHSAEIATRLGISAATVEAHRRNIMTKLGLHSIAELTKYAVREGLTSS